MADLPVEPWLRGTHTDLEPVRRAVLHALELAEEDIQRWAGGLNAEELESEPLGLPSVAFQLRHIARSVDRLSTYARGQALTPDQLRALREERTSEGNPEALMEAVVSALRSVEPLMRSFAVGDLAQLRTVGRAGLPTTLAGLLIHIAEHTQRHVGQAITTA